MLLRVLDGVDENLQWPFCERRLDNNNGSLSKSSTSDGQSWADSGTLGDAKHTCEKNGHNIEIHDRETGNK